MGTGSLFPGERLCLGGNAIKAPSLPSLQLADSSVPGSSGPSSCVWATALLEYRYWTLARLQRKLNSFLEASRSAAASASVPEEHAGEMLELCPEELLLVAAHHIKQQLSLASWGTTEGSSSLLGMTQKLLACPDHPAMTLSPVNSLHLLEILLYLPSKALGLV